MTMYRWRASDSLIPSVYQRCPSESIMNTNDSGATASSQEPAHQECATGHNDRATLPYLIATARAGFVCPHLVRRFRPFGVFAVLVGGARLLNQYRDDSVEWHYGNPHRVNTVPASKSSLPGSVVISTLSMLGTLPKFRYRLTLAANAATASIWK